MWSSRGTDCWNSLAHSTLRNRLMRSTLPEFTVSMKDLMRSPLGPFGRAVESWKTGAAGCLATRRGVAGARVNSSVIALVGLPGEIGQQHRGSLGDEHGS